MRAAGQLPAKGLWCAVWGRRCPRVGISVEMKGQRCTNNREDREGEEETRSSPSLKLRQQKPRLPEQEGGDALCAVPEDKWRDD